MEDWRKQGRDWITGELTKLTKLCALLRVTPFQGYDCWYFKVVLPYTFENNG